MFFTIDNLSVSVGEKKILKHVTFAIEKGQIHVVMGPNGSGKSTLLRTIAGHPSCHIDEGSLVFEGQKLNDLAVEERAKKGLFFGFQNPLEIPGVSNFQFLFSCYNIHRKILGEKPLKEKEFIPLLEEKKKKLTFLPENFDQRSLNTGFSGGEKKGSEIVQMLLLNPRCILLDEIDSGLDIDALKEVVLAIKEVLTKDKALLIITHNPRILHSIHPDFVHLLIDGELVKSGDASLAWKLEKEGYTAFYR